MNIAERENAVVELVVDSSKGEFRVRVEAEPVMVARDMNCRTKYSEPIYWVSWVVKASWKPLQELAAGGGVHEPSRIYLGRTLLLIIVNH